MARDLDYLSADDDDEASRRVARAARRKASELLAEVRRIGKDDSLNAARRHLEATRDALSAAHMEILRLLEAQDAMLAGGKSTAASRRKALDDLDRRVGATRALSSAPVALGGGAETVAYCRRSRVAALAQSAMTVCGFARTRDGSGFCWSDSEVYSADEPMAEGIEKLVSAGGLVGVSVGYVALVREFRRLVADLGRTPFNIAIARLPAQLRQARDEWRAEVLGRGADYTLQTTHALCGFSSVGFRGAVFAEASAFEPVERDAWSSPTVDRSVSSASDVLEFAQAQIRYVQVKSPTATGRALTIAKLVGPSRVECVSVPLLLAHERCDAHERARLVEIARRRECSP